MQAWDMTYLAVHFAAMIGCAALYREAPDWMQRVTIGLLVGAMAGYIAADLYVALVDPRAWVVRLLASRIEHAAVLVYVFRQLWSRSGACRYLKYSR